MLILSGHYDPDIAERLEVSRTTINRWKNHNPAFIATLNQLRQERLERISDKIRILDTKALEKIGEHIEAGNLSAVLGWLRISKGLAVDDKVGSAELEDVALEVARNYAEIESARIDAEKAPYSNFGWIDQDTFESPIDRKKRFFEAKFSEFRDEYGI